MTAQMEEKEFVCDSLVTAANTNVPIIGITYLAEWANNIQI